MEILDLKSYSKWNETFTLGLNRTRELAKEIINNQWPWRQINRVHTIWKRENEETEPSLRDTWYTIMCINVYLMVIPEERRGRMGKKINI